LVEIHVLRAIRKHHKIQLDKVRVTLDYLESQLQVTHPLAHNQFRTDGIDLFINHYGTLINASRAGQGTLKEVLNAHVERIEPDDTGWLLNFIHLPVLKKSIVLVWWSSIRALLLVNL
jgi:hypothetical protein